MALGFCLCNETLFIGKDPCAQLEESEACCPSCGEEQKPCDDCVVPITLEVSDYLWTADSYSTQAPVDPVAAESKLNSCFFKVAPRQVTFPPAFEPPPPLGRCLLYQQRRLLL